MPLLAALLGGLDGLWIGAIPGAAGGAMLGLAAVGLCSGGGVGMGDPNLKCDNVGYMVEGVVLGAALGAIVGAGTGVLIGRRMTFAF